MEHLANCGMLISSGILCSDEDNNNYWITSVVGEKTGGGFCAGIVPGDCHCRVHVVVTN